MDLRAWREQRRKGEEKELPSGLVVRLRRASLLDLAERGAIPAPMVGMVNEILDTKVHHIEIGDFKKYAEAINLVVTANVVEPPIAQEADETHLAVSELPMMDRMEIFKWACEVGANLGQFPEKPA